MSSKKPFKNGATSAKMAVTQDALENQPKYITVDKDRKFLLFLEANEDRIPITLEQVEGGFVGVTVNYAENRTLPLIELETPDTILGLFDLKDDSDGRFAKLCKVALAIWKVSPPTFDLLISTSKSGLTTADDKILWWKVAGKEKQEPPVWGCTLTNPVIQKRLLAYELVDTEVKQFEVIRKYRKLDDLAVARQARATHKDRDGNFYKKGEAGVWVGKVENGIIEWNLSKYYHMPEITEVL